MNNPERRAGRLALRGTMQTGAATRTPPAEGAGGVLGDALLCVAASVAWTWPLPNAAAARLRDSYDAALQAWQLAWVRHAATTPGVELFSANALAPARDVLAFTEPLVGYGLASLPFAGLGPAGASNAVCFLGLALLPLAVSLLSRELGVPRVPALIGALAASFGALTTVWLGYVTFAFSGLAALVLLAWLRLRRTGSLAAAAGLATSVAIAGWCCLQLLAFTLAALGFAVLIDLVRERDLRSLARTLGALAAAGLLLLPLGLKMREVRSREGFARSPDEVRRFSAAPGDWLATTSFNPGQAFLKGRSDSEKALYPGSAALLLSALGLATFRRHRRAATASGPGGARATSVGPVGLGVLLLLVGFLGSLGPSGPLFPLLSRLLPGVFGQVRAAARFAFVGRIGVGVLAACGAAVLLAPGGRLRRALVGGGLVLALAADQRQSVTLAFRPDVPQVDEFLAGADPGGPLLYLPASFRPYEGRYLVASTAHFRPIVNATMSFVPSRYLELASVLARDPIPAEALSRLEAWPVGALVLHEHALPPENRRATLAFLDAGLGSGRLTRPLRFSHADGADFLLGVTAVRGDRPWRVSPDGEAASRQAAEDLARLAAEAGRGGVEDPGVPCSIDRPEENARVSGVLEIVGWAQDEAGPCQVEEVRLDGDRRAVPVGRFPRPDVSAALPRLGDAGSAGWNARLAPRPGDEGPHTLRVRFRCPSGRVRTLDRPFVWAPAPAPTP